MPASNNAKFQDSSSPSSASASTPFSPVAPAGTVTSVSVESTNLPPAYLVKSFQSAFREIETLPGCEVMFTIKVVIPGYGVAETSETRPSRARTALMKELVKAGAAIRNRFVLLLLRFIRRR